MRGRDTSGNLVAYTPSRGDYTVLPAPTGVGAVLLEDNKVGLWWTDNSANESRFVVEWAPDGVNFDPAQTYSLTVNADQTTAVVTAPSSLASYELRVRAQTDGPVESIPRNANPPSEVAYTDDFRGQPGGRTGFLNPVWTNARYDWAATDRRFLGLYQDETTGLYLSNLPPHAKINVWIGWVGWTGGGGDAVVTVRADGQTYVEDGYGGNQGSVLTNSNGWMGLTYLHYSIPHISGQVALTFSGSGNEALSSYWGMWDIQVLLEYPIVSFFQSEGQYAEEGGRNAELYVVRSADLTYPLDIPFTVVNGTAQSDDYQLQPSGSLHLDAGQGMGTITASAADDTIPEWTENFVVRLGGSRRYFLDSGSTRCERKLEIVDNNDGSITGLTDVLVVNNDDDDESAAADMTQNDYDADSYPDWDNVPAVASEDDLYEVQLDFPQAAKPGATVSLSRGNNSPIRVLENNNRGGIAFINEQRGAYTWTLGQNDPPRTVWVEAIGGSVIEGDVALTLSYDDSTATTRPLHPTSATTTSPAATNVKVAIMFRGQDVTARRSPDVLIGQKIDPTLEIEAPPSWLPPADGYTWSIPGPTFRDYVANAMVGDVIFLGPDEVNRQSVSFYWSDGAPTGMERTVYVATTINGVIYQRYTRFNVFEPTATITETQGTVKLWYFSGFPPLNLGLFGSTHSQGGMDWKIRVDLPAGRGFAEGEWQLVHLVRAHEEKDDVDGSRWLMRKNDAWFLDDTYPYQGTHATGQPPVWQNDNPCIALEQQPTMVNIARVRFGADFQTWLMFKPAGQDARFVPLKKETWGFAGETSRANPTANWQDPPVIVTAPYTSGMLDSTEFPEWTQVIHGEDQYDWILRQ